MKINEGIMSEIDMMVNEYKDFCATHGREPTLAKCYEFVKARWDEETDPKDLFQIIKIMLVSERRVGGDYLFTILKTRVVPSSYSAATMVTPRSGDDTSTPSSR